MTECFKSVSSGPMKHTKLSITEGNFQPLTFVAKHSILDDCGNLR